MNLILASASPRRKELLLSIGLDFEVEVSHIEEIRQFQEPPAKYVGRLAQEKAQAVSLLRPGRWIVGADTTVVIEEEVLEKPSSPSDAIRMLSRLSGRAHTVFTGVHLLGPADQSETCIVESQVVISPMTEAQIRWYVDTGEPMDKAGAYAVQGLGSMFIESVAGSYTNVVGLPLATLVQMMRRAGIDPIITLPTGSA